MTSDMMERYDGEAESDVMDVRLPALVANTDDKMISFHPFIALHWLMTNAFDGVLPNADTMKAQRRACGD
ncbi:hypothetical protein KUV98_15070 [Mameliella alba]|nr:hypothetical protein [Mameliella alba]